MKGIKEMPQKKTVKATGARKKSCTTAKNTCSKSCQTVVKNNKSKGKTYEPVSKLPVAKFYYQGTHSHPVRRTVLVVEESKNQIVGYELREGNTMRNFVESSKFIKSYSKDKIANWGDYSRLRTLAKSRRKPVTQTTLERFSLAGMFTE